MPFIGPHLPSGINSTYYSVVMKFLAASVVLGLVCSTAVAQPSAQTAKPQLLITECAYDGVSAFIPYSGERIAITRIGDVELQAGFTPGNGGGATFWLLRETRMIFSFTVDDLDSGSIWVAVEPPSQGNAVSGFALTYSDGGAEGGWHVRVFRIDGDAITDVSKSIEPAVADFKSRHYCKTRGNNVYALKWIKGDLLLMTEVFPTSDCGLDMGHTEGYLVSVPDGTIREHLTLNQLRQYPGVCLQNYDSR